MVKCDKHGLWLNLPVGCWKCYELKIKQLSKNEPFISPKAPSIPPIKR